MQLPAGWPALRGALLPAHGACLTRETQRRLSGQGRHELVRPLRTQRSHAPPRDPPSPGRHTPRRHRRRDPHRCPQQLRSRALTKTADRRTAQPEPCSPRGLLRAHGQATKLGGPGLRGKAAETSSQKAARQAPPAQRNLGAELLGPAAF